MNALVQFILDACRRGFPRMLTVIRVEFIDHPIWTLFILILASLPAIGAGVMVSSLRHEQLFVRARYLVLLPDRYPDPEFTLTQRLKGVAFYVSRALEEPLVALDRTKSRIHLQIETPSTGEFVLVLRNQLPSSDEHQQWTTQSKNFVALLDKGAAAVKDRMPAGTEVTSIAWDMGTEESLKSLSALGISVVGFLSTGLLLFAFVAARSQVVDINAIKALWPASKVVRLAVHRDLAERTRELRPPAALRNLSDYLADQCSRGRRSVAIVSAVPSAGKTSIALLVAGTLARHMVVNVCDADRFHTFSDRLRTLDGLQTWASLHITSSVLTSDEPATRPRASEMREYIRQQDAEHMHVFDCSPLCAADGVLSILKQVSLIVLVVTERSGRHELSLASRDLSLFDLTPDVVVINRASVAHVGMGYYYPYYGESTSADIRESPGQARRVSADGAPPDREDVTSSPSPKETKAAAP